MKALKDSIGTLTTTVNGLESKIMNKMRDIIRQETKKFNEEVEILKGRMENMEVRFAALASNNGNSATGFDINCSVIMINLVQHDGKDTAQLCQESFRDVLGTAATVVRAERTQPRNNKPGLIKCQLTSVEEKINVLRNKKKIKDDEDLRRVFIARMRSHEERLIENNFKAILKELPNGNQYRFTGSGRLVDKRDEDGATGQGGGAGRQADLWGRRTFAAPTQGAPPVAAGDGTPVADRGTTHGGGASARRSTRQNANHNNQPR